MYGPPVTDDLKLNALLSQVLVAYTIEFDYLFEAKVPHTTTIGTGAGGFNQGGIWLVSQAMWTTYLRFVRPEGTPVRELQARARQSAAGVKSALHHLEWWHYLTFAPDPADRRPKPRYRDLLVHLTPAGRVAQEGWQPIGALMQKRWAKRFGKDALGRLQDALREVVANLDPDLPDYLPVVQYNDGLRVQLADPDDGAVQRRGPVELLDVSALLSRVLLGMALDYESAHPLSLTTSANVLRVVDAKGTPSRDLPRRGGVDKAGVVAATNFLQRNGYVEIGNDKDKVVRPTAKGRAEQREYARTDWQHPALEQVLCELDLTPGLRPPDGSWRTVKPYAQQVEAFLSDPRAALPHHPMILHRGGYPDGC